MSSAHQTQFIETLSFTCKTCWMFLSFISRINMFNHHKHGKGHLCHGGSDSIFCLALAHLAGHLCKRYPHVSFLMRPQGWTQQHSLQAFSFFLFQLKISIPCLRVLRIEESRRGEERVRRGWAPALALCCMKYPQLPQSCNPTPSFR